MFKKSLLSLLLLSTLSAEEGFKDFLKSDSQDFASEKKAYEIERKKLDAEFKNYKKIADEEFKAFKKSLGKYWKEPQVSTPKKWVEYSKDLKSRKVVDFDNNTITIDVHAKNAKDARLKLAKSLINTVKKDTKEAFKDDILSQRIEKRLKKAAKAKITSNPILAPLVFKRPPGSRELVSYAKKRITTRNVKTKRSKIPSLKRYSVTVALPKNTTLKKARNYLPKAKEMSAKFGIPVSVIMAVIQTESGFNPMARSHIPAYGLMQIVPRSAGLDVYNYLYKKRRLLSPSYLYNSNNNIKLGTAYLKLIYSKYLKDIKNPTSRLYCTIAAYNTGAGNVSRTFSGTNSPSRAARKINTMTAPQVYNYLVKRLKYRETRHYVQRVTKRAAAFSKHYN
jgi:membrane-bound lytic murein transglycosylase C